jgi:hypothetical protein
MAWVEAKRGRRREARSVRPYASTLAAEIAQASAQDASQTKQESPHPGGHRLTWRNRNQRKSQPAHARRSCAKRGLFEGALALTATAGRFRDLLTLLDRRLHVVAALLQLPQQTFGGKLALEVFDGTLNPFAVNDDLKRLTLNGFARVVQGTGTLAKVCVICKPKERQGGLKSKVEGQKLRSRASIFVAGLDLLRVQGD